MIAKGKSISHGAAMVDYAAGRDKAQFLTSKFMNLDFEETFGIMPDNVWNSFKIHAMRHSPISNSLMRFEIAPRREETEGWTHDDWKDLLAEFINELDSINRIRYRDKKGKLKEADVKPTNIKNSQSIAYLHLNTDDNHLHFLVNRIDEDGNVNDDSFLRNRCFIAAQRINERRGWQNTLQRSEEIKSSIRSSIYDALKPLEAFSWSNFIEAMKSEGIVIKPKYDRSNKVVSYRVHMEGCRNQYNASDIDRSLTAAHIVDTWKRVHEEYNKEALRAAFIESMKDRDDITWVEPIKRNYNADDLFESKKANTSERPSNKVRHPSVINHINDLIHHVITAGFHRFEFDMKRTIESLIRNEISDAVREEISLTEKSKDSDAKEYLDFLKENFDINAAFNMAALLFFEYVDGATTISNTIGGGGGSCTSDWGKKKDDDDEKWARRCARQAVKMAKPWHIGRSTKRRR